MSAQMVEARPQQHQSLPSVPSQNQSSTIQQLAHSLPQSARVQQPASIGIEKLQAQARDMGFADKLVKHAFEL